MEQLQDEDHGVGSTTHVDKFNARWAEGVHAAIPPGGATCMDNPKKKFLGRIHGDGVDLMN